MEEGSRHGAPTTALATSERWILRNGAGIQIMETLAVGAFLTALAVELGASNVVIGLLAAIPHLAQLGQIPALALVARLRARKRIYLVSGAIARPMLLVIAAAAFVPSPGWALALIACAFAVRYVAGSFIACSWSSWMRDLVPDSEMGRVFGARQKRMVGIAIVVSLAAAAFIDAWKAHVPLPPIAAYAVVYTLAFFGGAYSVWCSRRIVEPEMAPVRAGQSVFGELLVPFRDRNYRRLIAFLASWSFAMNLAAPFFTVHMLKRMELDLLWVIGFGTLSQLAAFLMATRWGAIADRMSNKAVLGVCTPLFVLAVFAWTFTTMPEKHVLTVPLLIAIHIATGFASAGVTLAAGNIGLKLAPRGRATGYLAAIALVNATAGGIAALIGGLSADLFAASKLSLTVHWQGAGGQFDVRALDFSHWDFFFFFAAAFGLFAVHRLSLVRERGEVEEAEVLRELVTSARQGLRGLSTVAGLRAATEFPVAMVLGALRRDRERD